MEWADATVWDKILNSSHAQHDARIRELVYHSHVTQYAFLHIWRDEPMDFPELATFDELEALCEWGRSYHLQAKKFLYTFSYSALQKEIEIPWAARVEKLLGTKPKSTTLLQTMTQVCAHSTYHRGQINAQLRNLGDNPPLVDFIAWIWLGKPEANWPHEKAE